MKEEVLRGFFLGDVTVADLRADLEGAVIDEGVIRRHPIVDMVDEHLVTCRDLLKLCDAILAAELSPEVLQPIGFCLIASDHFEWDGDDPDGEIVAETAADWSSPEINYPLTVENVQMFRDRLREGPSNQGMVRTG